MTDVLTWMRKMDVLAPQSVYKPRFSNSNTAIFKMLSLPIISLVAAFALINPVKSAAPTVDQTVEFVITSPTGLTTCLTANGNFDGAIVTVAPCGRISPFVKAWTVENGGSATGRGPVTNIRVFADKCLDVTGGVNADGTKVQVWTCAENSPNQNFNVNSDGSISWAGKGKCVDVTGGHFGDGTQLQVWTCSAGNSNQIFTSTALDPYVSFLLDMTAWRQLTRYP
ncbi:ricin B lectin domain-containing protein [Mycena floridula]|nr:ricin B lectin domain-containing protein [Mycena floridula]